MNEFHRTQFGVKIKSKNLEKEITDLAQMLSPTSTERAVHPQG